MRNSLNGLAGIVLAALFSVSGLSASAQTINLGISGTTQANVAPGFNCIAHGGSQAVYLNVGTATNVVIDSWTVTGDGAFSGGTGFTRTVAASNTSTGYGKIRVTVNYYYDGGLAQLYCANGSIPTCSDGSPWPPQAVRTYGSKSIDFYQTFTTFPLPVGAPTDYIAGPRCLSGGGGSVTYSVTPIATSFAQIDFGIGTDTYLWQVIPTAGGASPTFTYQSGDRSSITFTAPLTNYFVRVVVGRCNSGYNAVTGAAPAAFPVSATATKTITVTVEQPLTSVVPLLSCRSTDNNTAVVTINAQPNIAYEVQPPSAWTVTPAGTPLTYTNTGTSVLVQAFTFNTDGNVNNVTVVATGGCSGVPQSITRTQYRSFGTTVTGAAAGCIPLNGTNTVALTNAPVGAKLLWTIPAGVSCTIGGTTYTNPTPLPVQTVTAGPNGASITLRGTVAGNGTSSNVTVSMVGDATNLCPTTSRTIPITVNGPITGTGGTKCYTVNDLQTTAARTFSLTNVCGSAVPAPGTLILTAQLFNLAVSSTVPVAGITSTQNTGIFANSVTLSGTGMITNGRVVIRAVSNPTSGFCLEDNYTWNGPITGRPAPNPHGGTGPVDESVIPAQMRAYPNPAGQVLNVDVVLAEKGTVKLTLVDATGRVRQTQATESATATLDVRALPTGVYSLRAELPSGKFLTQTVQVQH